MTVTSDTTRRNGQPAEAESQPIIGRTSATEREPSTADTFPLWLEPSVQANRFDIVEVPHLGPSVTYGQIDSLKHETDAISHMANYASADFGDPLAEPNTVRQGVTSVTVRVLRNTNDLLMPVRSDQPVRFADQVGIERALRMDDIAVSDRIPAGLIVQTNGQGAVAYLDRRYVHGPEGVGINISGIPGMATKTSYAMFHIAAVQQVLPPAEVATIILNVKQGDLLHIDEAGQQLDEAQREQWQRCGLEPRPFSDVHYLLPRSRTGQPNSMFPPETHTLYGYDISSGMESLDLLYSHVRDESGAQSALIDDLQAEWALRPGGRLRNAHSWNGLFNADDSPLTQVEDPKTHVHKLVQWGDHRVASLGKLRKRLRQLVQTGQSGVFVERLGNNEVSLQEALGDLRAGHTYVIDIAALRPAEQTLVFGDVLRTVYELKAQPGGDAPRTVLFFVDELNRYAPKHSATSAIVDQLLDVARAGRTLGMVLISAQQFASSVHEQVVGSAETRVVGRSSVSELEEANYRFLTREQRAAAAALRKGEMLLSHYPYGQAVRVVFPMPAYRQQQAPARP